MASCLISKYCGQDTQVVFGVGKEVFDTVMCGLGRKDSCSSAFQQSDFDDNFTGATCPREVSCEQACKHLEFTPDRPPGPLGGGG